MVGLAPVGGCGHHLPADDDHRSDRDVAALAGGPSLVEGDAHPGLVVGHGAHRSLIRAPARYRRGSERLTANTPCVVSISSGRRWGRAVGASSVGGMRWTVHGESIVYDSPWVGLRLADVELPDGRRFDHHVIRMPRPAAGVVVADPERGVLLLWRHRFVTDSWGWEIPAGRVEDGETVAEGAAREVLEETGWRPGPLRALTSYHPSNGVSDQTFHLFAADGAAYVGDPTDWTESERVEWLPLDRLRAEVAAGRVGDGLSLTALCWCLAFDVLPLT